MTAHASPLTAYIVFLLKAPRTSAAAFQEARRLGVRDDAMKFYWEVMGQ